MKVNFFLKEPGKERSSIIAIMRYKGNRFKLTTGISVEIKFWEKSTRRAKKVMAYPEHEIINIQLERFEIAAKAVFNAAAIAGTMPEIEKLKKAINVSLYPEKQAKEDPALFLPYFINHYETANFKHGTKDNYITTANFIRKYETRIHLISNI